MASSKSKIKQWLSALSFRTGIIIATLCIVCYIISFAQMLLPISVAAKGILWTIFFGLAKAFQYSALLILGSSGITRIKTYFRNRKQTSIQNGK